MIKSVPDKDDNDFLKNSDVILLAGGDVGKGWDVIKRNGWDKIIKKKYCKGAILIGVSVGSIQLGVKGYQVNSEDVENETGFDTFTRFLIWCGTLLTEGWLDQFNIEVVVYGHLHIRSSKIINGIRHEEVSFGYP